MSRKRQKIEIIKELVNEVQPDFSGVNDSDLKFLSEKGLYPASSLRTQRGGFISCIGSKEADRLSALAKKIGMKGISLWVFVDGRQENWKGSGGINVEIM